MSDVGWVSSYQVEGAVRIEDVVCFSFRAVYIHVPYHECTLSSMLLQISGTLSYPLYFSLMDVFGRAASMNELQSTMQAYAGAFKDLSLLGVFESNHGANEGSDDGVPSVWFLLTWPTTLPTHPPDSRQPPVSQCESGLDGVPEPPPVCLHVHW
jgi:hypothetical protein